MHGEKNDIYRSCIKFQTMLIEPEVIITNF